jgi:glycosyltransferase involved in cell wall biosynthesis
LVAGPTYPKLSILLPTHNRADVLPFAIESALNQTEQNFELLIVGDGCTDGTATVVSQYLKDERIKWFDLPKGRFFGYDNRNKVLKLARGEYISFLAHDDIITHDHLALLSKHLDRNDNIDIVYSRSFWIDDHGALFPSITNLHDKESLNAFFDIQNTIPASCFMHRRSVFDKIGYWDENLERAADWDFWKKIINRESSNFIFEPTPTVFHFKAIWKSSELTWPADIHPIFQYLYAEDKNDPSNPITLQNSIGTTLQQNVLEKIKADPFYIDTLRQSTMALIDHIVYHKFSKLIFEKKAFLPEHENPLDSIPQKAILPEQQKPMDNSTQENNLLYKIKKLFS